MSPRRAICFLGLALVLASFGCGSSAGSCTRPAAFYITACDDYGDGYDANGAQQACSEAGGMRGASACATAGRVGHCVFVTTAQGTTRTKTVSYYPPTSAADAMADCVSIPGVVTATYTSDDGTVSSGPVLSLLAGGLGGAGSVDGIGAAARFSMSSRVAVDGAGNLYVADAGNHTIRKVVVATGAVTTLAGTAGNPGSTDGTGAAARFNAPCGVAADGAGNLYVADTFNFTIRKLVVATGAVTTLAGTAGMRGSVDGSGAAASFAHPYSLTVDGTGNLYVADTSNHTLRKVVVATGTVTTLAGTAGNPGSTDGAGAAARFNNPYQVAVDGTGNLYVADTYNYTIRKVVVATGAVTTLAGTAGLTGSTDGIGTARFNRPFGLAVDGTGNLYVADTYNYTIRKVVLATGAVTTLAGTAGNTGNTDGTGAAARFALAYGVAADSVGNLYVADGSNSTIRRVVVATGAVTTLVGSVGMRGSTDDVGTAARFSVPSGVAVDSAGNLYIADTGNSTIRKVAVATGAVTTLAGTASMTGGTDGTGAAARFSFPHGVTLDGAGNLYVADTGNSTIRKVVLATGAVTTLAGTAGMTGTAGGIGSAARFNFPCGVTVDGAGNLYVADTDSSTIRQVVVATGTVTTLAGLAFNRGNTDGTGAAASFSVPLGVAVDAAGNLYVADTGNSTIRKVVVATRAVTTLAGTAGMIGSTDGTGAAARFNGPAGVAVDGTGNLAVADQGNATIRKVQLSNATVTTWVGIAGQAKVTPGPLPARLSMPNAVAALATGQLFILDENSVLTVR